MMNSILGYWRMFCRLSWWRHPRQLLRSLVSLDDTPHNIALGTAIGLFVGMTPTGGMQIFLVLLIAPFIRFNRIAAVLSVYVSNPITAIPLLYLSYKIGTLFYEDSFAYADFVALFSSGWQRSLEAIFFEIGMPLVVGSMILAVICGVVAYPSMLWLVRTLRKKPPTPISDRPQLPTATQTAA